MELYYILLREVRFDGSADKVETDNCFKAISRTDSPYIGQPQTFSKEEMLEEYVRLATRYGGKNVKVGRVVYIKLESRARFVDKDVDLPWTVEGDVDIIK